MQGGVSGGAVASMGDLEALHAFTDAIHHAGSTEEIYEAALDAIMRTMGCDKASILLFDGAGRMQFVAWRGLSDRYRRKLSGHSPWTPTDIDPPPIFVPDLRETDEPDWIREEILREGIVGLGFVPLTVDGQVIGKFMTYHAAPTTFDHRSRLLAVTIARQLGFSIGRARADASRAAALAELKLSEGRFRQMTEEAPIMIWMSDPAGKCEQLNKLARDFWGVAEDGLDGFDWSATIHPDDMERVLATMGGAIARNEAVMLRGRYADRHGDWRVLQTRARPRYAGDGQFLGMVGVNVDITEQERAARQRELMMAELNHRVKNTLAVVQAIAQQTFRSERRTAAVATFLGRLKVLAKAHDILSRVAWESASLRGLAREVLAGAQAERGGIGIHGPDVLLPPKQALAVAIALHELQTNAIKYGALSVDGGRVSLEWRAVGATGLRMRWAESGGPPVTRPRRRGFGTLMLEQGLVSELDGRTVLDFRSEGLVCEIEARLDGALG